MPPLAAPTKRVIFPDGSRAPAMAEMRPLIAAQPMLRAPRPEMVAGFKGAEACCCANAEPQHTIVTRNFKERMRVNYFAGVVGKWKIASSTGVFPSALSITIFCLSESL